MDDDSVSGCTRGRRKSLDLDNAPRCISKKHIFYPLYDCPVVPGIVPPPAKVNTAAHIRGHYIRAETNWHASLKR